MKLVHPGEGFRFVIVGTVVHRLHTPALGEHDHLNPCRAVQPRCLPGLIHPSRLDRPGQPQEQVPAPLGAWNRQRGPVVLDPPTSFQRGRCAGQKRCGDRVQGLDGRHVLRAAGLTHAGHPQAAYRPELAPMLDLSLFRNRTFSGANTAMFYIGLAMLGTFFYASLHMQKVLGYSPVEAGAAFLPLTVLLSLAAPRGQAF